MWKSLLKKFDSTDSLVSMALGLAVVLVIGMTLVNYVRSKSQQPAGTTKVEENVKPGDAVLPTKHVVKQGETLWSISEAYYKSGYNWIDIQKENKLISADVIESGQSLTIPKVTPIVVQGQVSSASTSVEPKDKSYTVVQGDDLWGIAVKQYGNGYRWVDIAKANNLENPDLIHAGNVLNLP